jgi:hypothetical protein
MVKAWSGHGPPVARQRQAARARKENAAFQAAFLVGELASTRCASLIGRTDPFRLTTSAWITAGFNIQELSAAIDDHSGECL